MDGFHALPSTSPRAKGRGSRPPTAARQAAWDKAMEKFRASLVAIKTAMDAHAAVEQDMFAAHRALDELAYPACLIVVTDMEVYIKDSFQLPLHRETSQETRLITEADIAAYAGDDESRYASMVAALRAYRQARSALVAAYEKDDAIADAKNDLSSAAISRSDAQQLRLLRTPAPSFRELCWKIETLHKADCNDRTEELGWVYVLQELAAWAARHEPSNAPCASACTRT